MQNMLSMRTTPPKCNSGADGGQRPARKECARDCLNNITNKEGGERFWWGARTEEKRDVAVRIIVLCAEERQIYVQVCVCVLVSVSESARAYQGVCNTLDTHTEHSCSIFTNDCYATTHRT